MAPDADTSWECPHGVRCVPGNTYPFAGNALHRHLMFLVVFDEWKFVDPLLAAVGEPHRCALPDDVLDDIAETDDAYSPDARVLMHEV